MGTTVEFHDKIGIDRIETRVRELATRLKDHLRDRVPGARFHTPADPTLSAGVVVFEPPVADTRQAYNQLYEQYGIACAAMSGQFNGIRLCPHVYNTLDEVERVVEVVADLS